MRLDRSAICVISCSYTVVVVLYVPVTLLSRVCDRVVKSMCVNVPLVLRVVTCRDGGEVEGG